MATPEFKEKERALIEAMAALGHPIVRVSGDRTAEQQAKLFARGPTVTEKSGKPGDESLHQLGLASDFAFVGENGKPDFSKRHPWDLLGKVAKEQGFQWGGDWQTLKDYGHIQLPKPEPPTPAPSVDALAKKVAPVDQPLDFLRRSAVAAPPPPEPVTLPPLPAAPPRPAQPAPAAVSVGAPDYGYGNRFGTTTPKGLGFLGPLQRPDNGKTMSEYSIGVKIGGQQMEIPSIVPTLTTEEIAAILTSKEGTPPPPSVVQKAVDHAKQRLAAGHDVFAGPGEQQPLHPELARNDTPDMLPITAPPDTASAPPPTAPAPSQVTKAMPEPHKDIVKMIDNVPHRWVREPDPDGVTRRGGHWESTAPPPAAGRGTRAGLETPEQQQRAIEGIKTVLTLGGATAAGIGGAALLPEAATVVGASRVLPVATRLLASTLGGAATRMGLHIPEALVERTTGKPSGTTFPKEGTIGGAEGFANEAWPTFLEPVTSTAGTVLKFLGKAGLDKLGEGYASRIHAAWLRGLAARMAGLGGVGDAVAALGPIAATEGGEALTQVAPKLGTRTFSERAEGGLDWLKKKLFTRDLTHPELLEQGAEEIARRKAAPWRVPEPFPKPGRTGGDPHVNPFGFTAEGPPASAAPYQNPKTVLGELDPAAGDANWRAWVRGGPVRGPSTGPRVNTAPPGEGLPHEVSPGNPLGREPDAPVPDVAVTPRGFTGKPEDVVPPVTRGREGFAAEPQPDVEPTVTGAPQREPSRGMPGPDTRPGPPVSVNPTGHDIDLQVPLELDPATGKYVSSPTPAGRTNPGAGSVDTLITKLNETQTARQAGHPVDLTPDELVRYYERRVPTPTGPPREPMTAQQLEAAFDKMKAQNAAQRAAEMGEHFVSDASAPAPFRRTPQGFDVDLTGPNVIGGPEAPSVPHHGVSSTDVLKDKLGAVESGTVADLPDINTSDADANFAALQRLLDRVKQP